MKFNGKWTNYSTAVDGSNSVIYVAGGSIEKGSLGDQNFQFEVTNLCYSFHIEIDINNLAKQIYRWEKQPEMVVARFNHACIIMQDSVYAFCGADSSNSALSSIEILDRRPRAGPYYTRSKPCWRIMQAPEKLIPRELPVVCKLDEQNVLIMGGLEYGNNKAKDAHIFDVIEESF